MNHNIEKIEKSQVKITIELNSEEWSALNLEAYNKTKGKYAAQGFRKGKVPMKVLINTYGEGVFYDEAINMAFNKYYYDVLDASEEIFPVGQPELDIEKIDAEGLTFFALVPVKPEFTLGEYKGINFEKPVYNVEEADIDAEVAKKQEQASRMVDVNDRAAQMGDLTNINFEGFVDGVAFDGGKGDNFDLELGSHQFIPGFEEGVVEMKIGEEKSVMVKFPADYGEPTLADKDAEFKVTLNSIKVKEMPVVDDEFVKDVSEFDTVAELRANIKDTLEKDNEIKSTNELENKIVETICNNTEVEIPDAMINSQIDQMVQDFEYRLQMQYQGITLDMYKQMMGKNDEEFRADFKEQAEIATKSQLVIDAVITAEKIEATDAEIDAKVAELAERSKKSVEEYVDGLGEQAVQMRAYVARNVIIEKLFDFLKTANTIA